MGIASTHPLYAANGKLTAVFATDLSLGTISKFLRTLKVGKTGQSFILERATGITIATSTPELPFRRDAKGNPEPVPGKDSANPSIRAITTNWKPNLAACRRLRHPNNSPSLWGAEGYLWKSPPCGMPTGLIGSRS